MRILTLVTVCMLTLSFMGSGCKNMSRTQKGAIIGTGGGAAIGAIIGRASGNKALGAIIGATVGGTAGAIIGNQMDKQAEEIEKEVPGVRVTRVGEGIIVEFSDKILFGVNQADLNAGAKTNLNKLKEVLLRYPDTDIEIQGHTDNTGSAKYNMTLSKRRASSVSAYMVSTGISAQRISIKGYGLTAPNYTNDTEEGRSQNRRVEFLITANQKMLDEAKKNSSK